MENKTIVYDGREYALIYERQSKMLMGLVFAEIIPEGENSFSAFILYVDHWHYENLGKSEIEFNTIVMSDLQTKGIRDFYGWK